MLRHPLLYCLEVLKINRRWTTIKNFELNESIRDREVRLVGDDGEQLGVVSIRQAMDLAAEKKMDLVKVAPNAKPPVCRIMDYGKFKYEQQKKIKEAKKKQKQITVKEIRLSLNIDQHDLETKAKRARKFLEDGDRVKIALRFRGRQLGNTKMGYGVIDKFVEMVSESGTIDKKAKMEGRSMVAFMAPIDK